MLLIKAFTPEIDLRTCMQSIFGKIFVASVLFIAWPKINISVICFCCFLENSTHVVSIFMANSCSSKNEVVELIF